MGRPSPPPGVLPLLLLVLAVGVGRGVSGMGVVSQVIPTAGDEYLLNCGGSGDLQYFLLHQEGEALAPGSYDRLKIEVFVNASVYFKSVSVEHEGTHLCIRSSSTAEYKGYPTKLRVRPPTPDDLWGEVYEVKFVTGFLAALTIGALFVLGCLVQRYRWRPRESDTEPIVPSSGGYVNPAMTSDDPASDSTKM